ncbi:hypothetical protein [uncultured Parabacteroides sp.]|jgi:hypothetical protein|uniref:hypothetical protein n=1 Tax=uncultured Parabacteroides sp. TaxID=512312 RepID=UPI002587B1CC|nr:hypothetical protein [uncultured Parabacteroides sp.]
MRVDELLTNDMIERFRMRKETPQERDALVSIATKVLCRKMTYTCRNCYFDALMELVNLYKTNQILFEERMKEKRYQIARGVCMPLGFGSSRMIVYQNCTDELAIEFLSLDEKNSKYFEHLPDGWKSDVADYLDKLSGKDHIPVELTQAELDAIADMKKMLIAGTTKKAVKDHFVTFEKIGDVKVTKKYIDSLLKEASEQLKAENEKKTDDPDENGALESEKNPDQTEVD